MRYVWVNDRVFVRVQKALPAAGGRAPVADWQEMTAGIDN